jgi:ABC-type polysaccharide/polyol phosphate export permease
LMMSIRSVFASVWMGWQREIGWGNPIVSLLLRTAAPVAAALTVVFVYWFGSSQAGLFSPARLAYVVIGAALYGQVSLYAWVPTAAISEGKNTQLYPMVYISRASSYPYLLGRCIASFCESIPVVFISILVSVFVTATLFHSALPLVISPASIALLFLSMVVAFPSALGLGFALGAYSIFASKFEWGVPSLISGGLILFSEALFPASTLPKPLALITIVDPFTYFMRSSRDAILYGSFESYSVDIAYLAMLGLATLAFGLVAFGWGQARARQKGFIDKKTQ